MLSLPIQVLSLFVQDSSLDKETSDKIKVETGNDTSAPGAKNRLPDIEVMPLTTSALDDLEGHERYFSKIGVFSLLATLLQPKSRGKVRLGSSIPHDRPKVDLNLLSDSVDLKLARKLRLALNLGDAMKAQGFPLLRGVLVPKSNQSSDDMDSFTRHRARTTHHYSKSTCRMASESDAEAPGVVDDSLRVHGIPHLRV